MSASTTQVMAAHTHQPPTAASSWMDIAPPTSNTIAVASAFDEMFSGSQPQTPARSDSAPAADVHRAASGTDPYTSLKRLLDGGAPKSETAPKTECVVCYAALPQSGPTHTHFYDCHGSQVCNSCADRVHMCPLCRAPKPGFEAEVAEALCGSMDCGDCDCSSDEDSHAEAGHISDSGVGSDSDIGVASSATMHPELLDSPTASSVTRNFSMLLDSTPEMFNSEAESFDTEMQSVPEDPMLNLILDSLYETTGQPAPVPAPYLPSTTAATQALLVPPTQNASVKVEAVGNSLNSLKSTAKATVHVRSTRQKRSESKHSKSVKTKESTLLDAKKTSRTTRTPKNALSSGAGKARPVTTKKTKSKSQGTIGSDSPFATIGLSDADVCDMPFNDLVAAMEKGGFSKEAMAAGKAYRKRLKNRRHVMQYSTRKKQSSETLSGQNQSLKDQISELRRQNHSLVGVNRQLSEDLARATAIQNEATFEMRGMQEQLSVLKRLINGLAGNA